MFIWTIRTILVFGQISFRYGKTLPKKRNWGKITFWDYRENELIHWGYILKSSPMLGCSRRGFYFWKTNISGILGHAHFRKKSIFLIFGTYGYVFGTWMVRGWYVNGTWMVRGWYVDGTWMVRGWYVDSTPKSKKSPMRIILNMHLRKSAKIKSYVSLSLS